MTSGGNRKPAKAERERGAERGRRGLMATVSPLRRGHGERNRALLRIRAARGRACGAPLTPETSADPAGLTARARPKARPEGRAAGVGCRCCGEEPVRAQLMGRSWDRLVVPRSDE